MKIQILLFDGFDELDALAPYEVFRMAAAKGSDFGVKLVTLEGPRGVTASHGLHVFSQDRLQPKALDLLLVPGGGWNDRSPKGAWAEARKGKIPKAVAAIHAAGKMVASVCTGAMLLSKAGLTRGRRCTTHRGAMEDLRAAGAAVVRARVVDDGDLLTAGGVTSGVDLALWIVRRYAGVALAKKIATLLEYPPPPFLKKK